MKKVLILAIAAAMLLGSFAKAEEVSDWDREKEIGRIEAAENNYRDSLQDISDSIAHLNKAQDKLVNVEDTHGLLSAIGQEVTVSTSMLKEISSSYDIVGAYRLRDHLREFSKQVDSLIKSQGL